MSELRALLFVALVFCVSGNFANADKIVSKSGRVYEGLIIGETDELVTIQMDGVAVGLTRNLIDRIEKTPVEAAGNSLPRMDAILVAAEAIAPEQWVQVPATVIDEGILRNVPYKSYRAGKLEMNIYGDPEAPAGVEVGIYGSTTSTAFKARIIAFIAEETKAEFPEKFNLEQDKKRLGGIDYEVTPASAPDAYGAWWVSVYDQTRLATCRVADNELNEITINRADALREAEKEESQRRVDAWTAREFARAVRPASDVASSHAVPASPALSNYTGYAGSGRVWVRGYTRKNGTYVQAHSRSR